MIGKIFIYLAFALSFASMLGFFSVHKGKEKFLKTARILFLAGVAFVIAASALQMYNILTHQFQYTYVWQQSNRELPVKLRLHCCAAWTSRPFFH